MTFNLAPRTCRSVLNSLAAKVKLARFAAAAIRTPSEPTASLGVAPDRENSKSRSGLKDTEKMLFKILSLVTKGIIFGLIILRLKYDKRNLS